jgi:ATP-dependent RNA helicase MSS116
MAAPPSPSPPPPPATRVLELHSRLSQGQRTRNADAFRNGSAAVLFASDVAARGIDFPDVTLVIQFGIASDASQVVHRAGRTGRGGKHGEALTLLGDDEVAVLPELAKLGLAPPRGSKRASTAVPSPELAAAFARISTAGDPMRDLACAAFVASLGFYKSNLRRLRWTTAQLVANVTARFEAMGLRPGAAPPCPIPAKLGIQM